MKYFLFIIIFCNILNAQNYTFKNKTFYLAKVRDNIYINEHNKEVKLKKNFFIKIKENIGIKYILNTYSLTIIKAYSKQLYLVQSDDINILNLIQQINNDINIVYAYPNFYKKLEVR
ncbi:MAG TPA: hypothetical protein ENK67_08380 [Flavobacteriia bacterium]|nr:hypothetical protein [Flavobacteriia bacterium]